MPPWTQLPLLAQGIEDVIGIIVFIVIALISWAAQAAGSNKKKQEQERRRQARQMQQQRPQQQRPQQQRPQQQQQPPVRAQQAGGGAGQRPGQGGLQDEIGEFLRDAARRRQQGGQPAGAAGPGQPARRPPGQGRPIPPRPQPRRATMEPVVAEVIEPSIEERAAEVGRLKVEAEREAKRSRQQRWLKEAAVGGASGGSTGSAAAIRQMFTNPLTLRQAVIAAEVFRRPEDRWE